MTTDKTEASSSTESQHAVGSQVDRGVRHVSEARWCVKDSRTGMPVAQGCAPTAEAASREATHYAVQYAQDHPVRWWVRQDRKTLVQGQINGCKVTMQNGSGGQFCMSLSSLRA